MKKNIYLKILLTILILLVFIVFSSNEIYATSYEWNDNIVSAIIERLKESSDNSVLINNDILNGSDYIFCREHGNSLGSTLRNYKLSTPGFTINGFKVNKNPLVLPDESNSNSDLDESLAYALSEIKNYPKATYDKYIQRVVWTLLGQYNVDELNDVEKNIYYRAYHYPEYRRMIETFKNSNNQDNYQPIINSNQMATQRNENLLTVGPFSVSYVGLYKNDVSFGTVTLYLKDSNGNIINEGITFIDSEQKEYNQAQISSTKINVKNNFYVKLDLSKVTTNVKLCVTTEVCDARATVCFINTDYYKNTEPNWCYTCQEKYDDNTPTSFTQTNDYDINKVYIYNGFLWKYSGTAAPTSQTYCKYQFYSTSNLSSKLYETGQTTTTGYVEGYYVICTECPFESQRYALKIDAQNYLKNYSLCPWCTTPDALEIETRYKTTIKDKVYKFYKAGCNTLTSYGKRCGEYSVVNRDYQKLFILETSNKTETTSEATFDIINIPSIKITLNKLSSKGVNLNDAEFKIEAKQGDEIYGSFENVKENEQITINPKSYEPIYLKITETKAPNGYTEIKESINVIYYYNQESKYKWNPQYVTTEEQWGASGWSWGGWAYIEEGDENGTALPNKYKSKSDDLIYVSQEINSGVLNVDIKVYDEAVIEKLTLLKVDANDVNTKLKGAIFSGTITNIKSFKYGGQQIVVENENNTYSFSYTLENGEIALEDVVLADEDANVEITLTEMKVPIPMDENNNIITDYYYKKLEGDITLTLIHNTFEGLTLVSFGYSGEEEVTVNGQNTGTVNTNLNSYEVAITIPNQRIIDISGKVWLDGQTGIKPARTEDGIMQNTERGVSGVIVELFEKVTDQQTNKETFVIAKQENNNDASTVTGNNGAYTFTGVPYGREYTVKFTYDGINYEDTLYNVDLNGRKSDAQEDEKDRSTFNARFNTITYKKSNDDTALDYDYIEGTNLADPKSILITKNEDNTAQEKFRMTAKTNSATYTATNTEIDLGLVKRGTDLALSTNLDSSKVIINGHTTNYTDYYENDDIKVVYNEETETWEIGSKSSFDIEDARYNFNLYSSDYNYRINDYVTSESWKGQLTTAEELKVYVTYKLKVENQSTKAATIDEITYKFDDKYNFSNKIYYKNNDTEVSITNYNISNNIIKIKDIELVAGTSQTIFLVFEIPLANLSETSSTTFLNSAEITSYSTAEGLIDKDSQPGNLWDEQGNPIHYEDDSDKANGINVNITDEQRQISGYVFDDTTYNGIYSDDEAKVNGVIVQLIELKTVNNNVYEYIWQETVSGSNVLKKLNAEGTAIETYEYCSEDDKVNGKYQFEGFIPGDYIVRFIYGDGSEYTYVANGGNKTLVTYNGEHNGQDYKSTIDNNYQAEWYNTATYNENASVARDNEARRLETMAYSVEIDAKKGLLLKLLDNVKAEDLNITEKETLISVYNELYDPDISVNDITDNTINKLLKEQTLKNTWMCAETSKIKIPVDSTDLTKTSDSTNVKATDTMQKVFDKVNFGLTKRPKTEIEVEKYITAFKLTATNGQVLVNAYMDVNAGVSTGNASSYFDKQDNLKGIKNSLKVIDTSWSYEIPTTEINTLVDGAKLEYEYTLVVKNSGEVDYLSKILTDEYMANTVEYKNNLVTKYAEEAKTKSDNYQIGKFLGTKYYTGVGEGEKVLTEVTHIRDYLHNDIEFIKGKGVDGTPIIAEKDASGNNLILKHRILDDRYAMQNIDVKTYLKTEAAGKMEPDGNAVLYSITLGKNPVDVSDGYLTFSNYIAEVMSYTNAAGRRAESSTPGNAEIIQDYPNTDVGDGIHEIDEASTSELKIVPTAGEDKQTNYIIITAVMLGLVVLTVGILVTKKHIKK